MDIDKKSRQLFGTDPKDQPFMANMSDARAKLIYKIQKSAFKLGVQVGMDWEEKPDAWDVCNCPDCGKKMCHHDYWEEE